MKLLIYCPDDEEKVIRLLGAVRQATTSPVLQLCHDLDQLSEMLRNIDNDWDVILALINTSEELAKLGRLGSLVMKRRTILMLEKQNKEITKKVLDMGPTYFTDYPDGLDEVGEVLSHLAEKSKNRGRGGNV